jgi:hypothetical protein
MQLYYIADNQDSENWDLFVWANSPDDAVVLWRDYYWGKLDDQSEDKHEFPERCFIVPLREPAEPVALRWHGSFDGTNIINEVTIPTKQGAIALGLTEAE